MKNSSRQNNPSEPIISVKKLVKKFHNGVSELVALKGLSFDVPQGQFVAIKGRSGSGKSTLLYQMSLLDKPTSGAIHIDGVDILNLAEKDRTQFRLYELGYVFQDYALIPTLNAQENVMVPLLMQGMSPIKARTKAVESLERVGLKDKMKNLPSQLSGGQQQRVSIARAIAHEPKILFADEPTANLDNETSLRVLETFIQLHKEGQTIVMVTHEDEYAALTDRIITLFDGDIVKDELSRKNP